MSDAQFMVRAIQLARNGLYTTDPNPRVGCVLVKDGDVVGEGWHVRAGEPHAERIALAEAGEKSRGATAYVTLEPCSHHGRTPPCADGLIEAGVAKVIAAMEDPNPQVAGKGLAKLRESGIETECGLLQAEAAGLNPGYIKRMRTGKPYVRCKLAMSLDGRTAMASGESQWITGGDARADVHRLRARTSAIVTGSGTVLSDNPSLTARVEGLTDDKVIQPLRVVLDSHLATPPSAKMLSLPGETLIVTTQSGGTAVNALFKAGAEVVCLNAASGKVDLNDLLSLLAQREINEVLVETGAVLAGNFLSAGLLDELIVYMAPHIMGDQARGLFHLPGLDAMDERIALQITDVRAVGKDWRITAKPERY